MSAARRSSPKKIWKPGDLRLLVVGIVFVLVWGGIGFRLFDLQGNQAVALATVGFDQRISEQTIAAARGTIYDRDGVEIALTIDGWNVVVDPMMLDDTVAAATVLAPFADVSFEELVTELSEGQAKESRYAEIAMRVNTAHKEAVEAAVAEYNAGVDKKDRLTGVFYRKQPLRVYPAGSVAAQVIGLTAYDTNAGIEGLELTFNSELEGEPGRLIVERDPSGRVIPQGQVIVEPAVAGSDIVTTIDREIQFAAEQGLRRAIQTTGAHSGAVVVLDPDTGAILAMASAPGFDLNDRSEASPAVLRNRAVSDMYEPGSTLKVLTVAAALEEGIVSADTMIDTPHTIEIGDFTYSDHGSNPPQMTVRDVVAKSSNIGTIHIEQMLGKERHYDYLTKFGLGRQAGLDVEGERHGTLPPTSQWTATSGSSIAIGYAVHTTALQMAALYAAIANDGVWTEPYLVDQIIQPDGKKIRTAPRAHRVLSPETATTVRSMLGRVIEEGTGSRAALTDYTAGGKTGTTDKFDVERGVYSDDTYASFIGMAPLDDPRVVVAIVLDTPHGQLADGTSLSLGGASAAPVFAEVAQNALHQLGVAPDRD
ncbi:MAG: penicillin-binding protein 2 [Armatimonadetes bacterium]|nr:MAG: penicillin-binding protein 2 [Armatimonadota bacterium]